MLSTILFLLPVTASAASACRPRSVVSHSAGFLAPTSTTAVEVVHRPDDFMAPPTSFPPQPAASQPVPSPSIPSPSIPSQPVPSQPVPSQPVPSQPAVSQPNSAQSTPSQPAPLSSAASQPPPWQPAPSASAGLDFSLPPPNPSFTSNPSVPASTFAPSPPISTPTPTPFIPSFTYAPPPPPSSPVYRPSDISFASWANPSTLLTSSAPSPSTLPPFPQDWNPGDFLLCTDTEFTGECMYMHGVTFLCQNLPAHLQRRATSIRPDKNQTCMFYDDENCHGNSDWIRYPGSGNLRGRRFDERVVSWMCREDGCTGVHGPGGCTENQDGSRKVWG